MNLIGESFVDNEQCLQLLQEDQLAWAPTEGGLQIPGREQEWKIAIVAFRVLHVQENRILKKATAIYDEHLTIELVRCNRREQGKGTKT
ncbi:hypothetical protein AWENTII_003923 [Aspergillus wentii]